MLSFLQKLLVLSLVVVSLEAAADMLVENIPHGDESSHHEEFGHGLGAHGGELSDVELDGEHCQHCCHGHCSAGAASFLTPTVVVAQSKQQRLGFNLTSRSLAPPTPPPNT